MYWLYKVATVPLLIKSARRTVVTITRASHDCYCCYPPSPWGGRAWGAGGGKRSDRSPYYAGGGGGSSTWSGAPTRIGGVGWLLAGGCARTQPVAGWLPAYSSGTTKQQQPSNTTVSDHRGPPGWGGCTGTWRAAWRAGRCWGCAGPGVRTTT